MNYNLSENNFIENVEGYTGNPLNRKEDIKRLIGIVTVNEKEEEFEKLAFTSKYVCGLTRIVKSSASVPEVTSIEHIEKDLNENVKKGMEELNEIISNSDQEQKSYFEKTYLSLTTESISNLYQIFSDLEAVKKYINYLKRLTK